MDPMSGLFLAVLGASVLGSVHCAGMCGAFLTLSIAGTDGTRAGVGQAAYHLGRLTTYMALGLVAGFLGSVVDLGGAAFGVRRAAMVVAGVLLAGFGFVHLLRAFGVRVPIARAPKRWARFVEGVYGRLMRMPVLPRAFLIGWATTLLPCGWLYAYVVTAAGTGSAVSGALVMAVFWLGTVPALAAVGVGVRAASGRVGRRLPVLMPAIVVALGGWTVAHAVMMSPAAGAGVAETCGPGEAVIDLGRNGPAADGQARSGDGATRDGAVDGD